MEHSEFYSSGMYLSPIALRKAKIAHNFGLSECNRVKGADGMTDNVDSDQKSLIYACTVCSGVSVQILKIYMVVYPFCI